jgi:hypothetical protein
MKKLGLIILSLTLWLGAFSQAKYQAKVVVVFMGEKNPTFDESLFPNCEFYYTPGITATEKKVNTLSGKIAGNITGNDYSQTYDVELSGTPEAAYKTNILETVLFDKNGYISGLYKSFENIALSPKKNLQGTIDFENYNAVSKDFIKKGKETKKAKKAPKKPHHLFDYYGMEIPFDFDVENAAGEKKSIRSIVKGEALTILHTLYVSPDADFKSGLESGENKTGKEYLRDQNNTSKSFSALKILFKLEEDIFGHTVVL